MRALHLKDLAQKTRRGQQGRILPGHCLGASGELVRRLREIVPEEAAVVRRTVAAYASGASPRTITRMLNGEKIPGPRGGFGGGPPGGSARQRPLRSPPVRQADKGRSRGSASPRQLRMWSSRPPEGERSWMSRGTVPSAWVEQERQGS